MIITRIIPGAGMGNQMFMYAAGLAVAEKLHTELRISARDFTKHTKRNRPYYLDSFPAITEQLASFSDTWDISPTLAITNLAMRHSLIIYRVLRRLIDKFDINIINPKVYRPKYFSYSSEFESIHDGTYIVGFWESERIFADIKELVRKKFTFSSECFASELTAQIRACNSVALHVRRTDKVRKDDSEASNLPYISKALKTISSMTDSPRFFVFSDDIKWCKDNIHKAHDADYTFIEGQTPPQDMALMTKCKHVIVGPSTFSWWGAWLNDNPNKIIIAPDIHLWYKQLTSAGIEDRKYLLPPEWIKIS